MFFFILSHRLDNLDKNVSLVKLYLSELPYGGILSCSWILDGQGVDRRQRGPVDPSRTITSSCHRPVNGAVPSAVPSATL